MGMGGGGGRGEVTSDINVTPMADVMLVLLIIFMVITRCCRRAFPASNWQKRRTQPR
jgi:biopolymer transport protein ExbD